MGDLGSELGQSAPEVRGALQDVLVRVERRYLNEVAEKRQAERVGTWLAGVSFNEWFALVAEYKRLLEDAEHE